MNYPSEVLWIKRNKDVLNLKSVAKDIGIPAKNLWNYCNDVHSLNEKWWPKAIKWVKKVNEN